MKEKETKEWKVTWTFQFNLTTGYPQTNVSRSVFSYQLDLLSDLIGVKQTPELWAEDIYKKWKKRGYIKKDEGDILALYPTENICGVLISAKEVDEDE